MEAVARALLGEPNKALSSVGELRWGRQGSMSVDLVKGCWRDHENGVGGGVFDLVAREKRLTGAQAFSYLRQDLGLDITDNRKPRQKRGPARIVAEYDYADENGEVLFQVVRLEPKDFRQRRPDPAGPDGWSWSVKGVRQVPYRLHELVEAIAMDRMVYVVEGEKDVDALARLGVVATCNAGGAGKWPAGLAEFFRGARVCILPDNDEAGRKHADLVGSALAAVGARVAVLDLPGLPHKGDVSDWLKSGGEASGLALMAESAAPWRAAPPQSRFGAVAFADIDKVEVRRDWRVDGVLYEGDFALSYGASQSGKSFLAVDLGLAVARGAPFLGKATSQGAVLYQAGEGGLGLLNRLKAYRHNHRLAGQALPFILLPARLDLFGGDETNGVEPFLAEIEAFKTWLADPLRLVVIDTFSTATPGANENASEDMSRALCNIQRIQEGARCAVLVVHHKNAGGEKPRGHTSLYANADTALEVIRDDKDKHRRTLHIAKVKDGEDGERIGFELQSVQIGSRDDGKPITSCVVVPVQDGPAATSPRLRKPPGHILYMKTLAEVLDRHGGVVAGPGIPTNMVGVAWEAFRDIYALASIGKSDTAISSALSRDGQELRARGLIGGWRGEKDHWIWITDQGRQWLRR
jgi:hypothetical protein